MLLQAVPVFSYGFGGKDRVLLGVRVSTVLKSSAKAFFLLVVFFVFVVMCVLGALGLNSIGYSSNYFLFFLQLLYFAGILPLFFAFWLVFSQKTRGDWKFGLLAFLVFLLLLYYHYLSIYALSFILNFKYLLILDELLLTYIFMSMVLGLSAGLAHDGSLEGKFTLEAQRPRFRIALTFFLFSLFALYFYQRLGDYTQLDLGQVKFSLADFPYVKFLQALLNTGLMPLLFALWIVYSRAVHGTVYYYITLVFILVFIYSFQAFWVVFYYHTHPANHVGYWLLEAMVAALVYLGISISIVFSDTSAQLEPREEAEVTANATLEEGSTGG